MKKNISLLLVFVLILSFCVQVSEATTFGNGSKVWVTTKNGLNMRAKASSSSKIVMELPYGTELTVISKGKSWSHVQYDDAKRGVCIAGYVSNNFISSQNPKKASSSGTSLVPTKGTTGKIRYISQSSQNKQQYDPKLWNNIDSSRGCYVACVSMAISSLGYDLTPGQIYNNLGRSLFVDSFSKAAKINGKTLFEVEREDCKTSNIDKFLALYLSDPSKYSPPIVSTKMMFNKGPDSHAVLVIAKNADGTYQIMDSSAYNNTSARVVKELTESRKHGGQAQMVLVGSVIQYIVK